MLPKAWRLLIDMAPPMLGGGPDDPMFDARPQARRAAAVAGLAHRAPDK
jgi:hypothetical protein